MTVKSQVRLGGGDPDEHAGVDLRSQLGLFEDPDHVEPHPAHRDALAWEDVVYPETLGGGGTEDGHWLVLVGAVQVLALGHGRPYHSG